LQTTLLGLALALIAAILAAFAAPFFVDWNGWRPQLEAQASALAGSRVTIAGNIDLTLLPTPAFVLRNVSLGDADNGTGMRASEVRGSLSLTALISGRIEAYEFVVSRPAIRIAIEKDGRLSLPEAVSAGQELSVGGFVFEAGSLTIEDRRTNSFLLADDFSARGELVSRDGPLRLEGGFRLNGMRWILRASSGRFSPEHSGKIRLTLDRPADALFFEAEGLLSLANAMPHFDGKAILAHRSGVMHWRIAADAAGDANEIRLDNLELALGEGELPITLTGEAKFVPRGNGAMTASLSSKRIDLDLGDQKAGTAGAPHVLPWLTRARELLAELPFSAQISIAADGVLAGGQLSREVRASLRTQNGVVAFERLEARLPGRSVIGVSGKEQSGKFSGPFAFETEEPQAFARWLLGSELAGKLQLPNALRVKGTLTSGAGEVSLVGLQAEVENTKVGGTLVLEPLRDEKSYILRADLVAERLNADALLPIVRGSLDAVRDLKFSVNLKALNAQLLGKTAKSVAVAAERLDGDLVVKDFALEDLDGVSLTAKRTAGSEKRYEFSASAVRTGGLVTVLEYFSESADFAQVAAKYAASHLPLRISGNVAPLQNGWRLFAKSGDAELSLDLGEARERRRAVEAVLRLPETEVGAKGELRFPSGGRVEPQLALSFRSSDLRKAFVLADRASASALPVSGTATLLRAENTVVFDNLAFDLAGSRGTGRLLLPIGEVTPYSGNLVFARADVATLASLALGRAHQTNATLSVPPLSNFPGTLQIEIGTLQFSERVALTKAAFSLRAGRSEIVFDNLRGELGTGKLTGSIRFADTNPRVIDLRLDLADVPLAQLVTTKALRGTLRASLALSASGDNEDTLLNSIAGQGNLSIGAFELDQTDATSVSSVFASIRDAPDEKKIEDALLAALARGPLKVSKLEAPFVAANGIFRSGSARAKAGNIEIALSGLLDLPKRRIEALLNVEVVGSSSVQPGATLRWEGPLSMPERKVDARALVTAITLRAIERGAQNQQNIAVPPAPPAKQNRPPDQDAAPPLPPPANILPAPQPPPQPQN
jgi:hypothetical protein